MFLSDCIHYGHVPTHLSTWIYCCWGWEVVLDLIVVILASSSWSLSFTYSPQSLAAYSLTFFLPPKSQLKSFRFCLTRIMQYIYILIQVIIIYKIKCHLLCKYLCSVVPKHLLLIMVLQHYDYTVPDDTTGIDEQKIEQILGIVSSYNLNNIIVCKAY